MSHAAKIHADLCTLWDELVVLPACAQRERKELLDTVQSKLPQVKYFKLVQGAFIKVSIYPGGRDVLEILDLGGLPEGLRPNIILGTLVGWCAALQFVQLATVAEYAEALDIVLEAEPQVLLMETVGAC